MAKFVTEVKGVNNESIKLASDIIKGGGLVAFKTETVYGLGANAYDEAALAEIYQVKGRPSDNPLIVHLSRAAEVDRVARDISDTARLILNALMPGPITVVLNRKDDLPARVSGGRDSIAVRVPLDMGARIFISACGVPIAAPSANTSTRPSPTSAKHVVSDLNGKIPLILDGGECEVGLESTVVDVRGDEVILLRRGGVAVSEIESVIGRAVITDCVSKEVVSPGTKYRHYAPSVPLVVVGRGDRSAVERIVATNSAKAIPTVIMGTDNDLKDCQGLAADYYSLGADSAAAARRLFGAMRILEVKYGFIVAIRLSDEGLGASVNSRLDKAAAIM